MFINAIEESISVKYLKHSLSAILHQVNTKIISSLLLDILKTKTIARYSERHYKWVSKSSATDDDFNAKFPLTAFRIIRQ